MALNPKRKRLIRGLVLILGSVLFLLLYIDDWGRDFTTNEAAITAGATDPSLRPLRSERTLDELVTAVRGAARRIRNWEYIGEARDEKTVSVLFERTQRVFRLKDDITIRIEDRGDYRLVTGVSASRWGFADLGRNPKNLRRLLAELRAVLEGLDPPPRGAA